jgi:hypothetical protein
MEDRLFNTAGTKLTKAGRPAELVHLRLSPFFSFFAYFITLHNSFAKDALNHTPITSRAQQTSDLASQNAFK